MLKNKKYTRIIALILCFAMFFSFSAFAVGEGSGELLPLSVVEFFADQGYEISRTAKMELVEVSMSLPDNRSSAEKSSSFTQKQAMRSVSLTVIRTAARFMKPLFCQKVRKSPA